MGAVIIPDEKEAEAPGAAAGAAGAAAAALYPGPEWHGGGV